MGKIGHGYGSEWHLLRYLGYHRCYLSEQVLKQTGGIHIDWLDFKFSESNQRLGLDNEYTGLEFIDTPAVLDEWKEFWPQSGRAQNWDAIGKLQQGTQNEWLLVEAKGHAGELNSHCGASAKKSIQEITGALQATSDALGNQTQPIENWLAPFYQYANRLAVLHFLTNICKPAVPARLLFIYFYGDKREATKCPQSEEEWLPDTQKMNEWLGVDKSNRLFERVNYLYVPVNPLAQ